MEVKVLALGLDLASFPLTDEMTDAGDQVVFYLQRVLTRFTLAQTSDPLSATAQHGNREDFR
jgi:hypothetical protein